MSRAAASFAPELAVWGKTAEEHSSTFRQMLLKIKDLDQRLQETTAELNNEIETRRNWMKRANDVESRTVGVTACLRSMLTSYRNNNNLYCCCLMETKHSATMSSFAWVRLALNQSSTHFQQRFSTLQSPSTRTTSLLTSMSLSSSLSISNAWLRT